MSLVIRIRTQIGTWRLNNVHENDLIRNLRNRVECEHHTDLLGRPFSRDMKGLDIISDELTVSSAGIRHGDMIFAMVDETKTAIHENATSGKRIALDGSIVQQEYSEFAAKKGFRPGMMPLGSMKKAWTLNDFLSLDEKFQFKLNRQTERYCKICLMNVAAMKNFQEYMMKVAYLYGTFSEPDPPSSASITPPPPPPPSGPSSSKAWEIQGVAPGAGSARVEFIYEPPQECTDTEFQLLEDPNESTVEALAALLQMRRVGWLFSHPTREKGFHFTAAEVVFSAEQQLLSSGGVTETPTPFVTLKATVSEEGLPMVEAFQVSKQCMEAVAEGVLGEFTGGGGGRVVHRGALAVNPTFTVYGVDSKPTTEVDADSFLVNIGITSFESDLLLCSFPWANREPGLEPEPSVDALRKQISKAGKEGWTLPALLADFQLLLFLTQFLSLEEDLPRIVRSVLDESQPLDEGDQMLLRSYAGLD